MKTYIDHLYVGKLVLLNKQCGLTKQQIKKLSKSTKVEEFKVSKAYTSEVNAANSITLKSIHCAMAIAGFNDVQSYKAYILHGDQVGTIFLKSIEIPALCIELKEGQAKELTNLYFVFRENFEMKMMFDELQYKAHAIESMMEDFQLHFYSPLEKAKLIDLASHHENSAMHKCGNEMLKFISNSW